MLLAHFRSDAAYIHLSKYKLNTNIQHESEVDNGSEDNQVDR